MLKTDTKRKHSNCSITDHVLGPYWEMNRKKWLKNMCMIAPVVMEIVFHASNVSNDCLPNSQNALLKKELLIITSDSFSLRRAVQKALAVDSVYILILSALPSLWFYCQSYHFKAIVLHFGQQAGRFHTPYFCCAVLA